MYYVEGVPWKWSSECEQAVENLKSRLCSAPILGHPDFGCEFELHTDASGVGLGASLNQWQDGSLRTIGYSSRTLTSAERYVY
jgi:hypothetical protein